MAKKKENEAADAPSTGGEERVIPRLQRYYHEQVKGKLLEEFGYKSTMQVPVLEKIVINVGIGEASKNAKLLDSVVAELAQITGQQPVVRRAKKAISNFGLREGMPVGASVTLRRERMWEFVERLISLAMPRVRDFRGVSPRAFDGAGNYTLGLKEQIVFPEIDFDKIDAARGMNVTFVTTAETNEEGKELLTQLGMPFRS